MYFRPRKVEKMKKWDVELLSQSNAEEIANHWHYEGIYAFYDMQADPEDYKEILSPEVRSNHYYQVLKNDELYGFFCLFPVDRDKQELGLGMKPEYCGKGQGQEFLQTILRFIEENISAKILTLSVADFNQRDKKLYLKCGFSVIGQQPQASNGDIYLFVMMERELK